MSYNGVGLPHLDYPGVSDTRRLWIPAGWFAGVDGAGGWQPDATSNGPIKCLINIPDICPGADILPRVIWTTSSTTTTQTATWRMRLAKIPLGGTVNTATATLTALDTTFGTSAALATANAPIQTTQGKKIGGILADATDMLLIAVDITAVSGLSLNALTGDRVTMLGAIIEYTRQNL